MVNLVSMNSSRMSIRELLVKKMLISINVLVGLLHQEVPKLLLICSFVLGKPLRLECKQVNLVHSQPKLELHLIWLSLMKELLVSIKVLLLFGLDKFLILLLSLLHLNKLLMFSMIRFSLNLRIAIARELNFRIIFYSIIL